MAFGNDQELAVVLKLIADQFQSEMKKSGGIVGDFSKILGDWRVQFGALATGLVAIAKSTSTYAEGVLKASQQTSVATDELQKLQFAAKLTNVDAASLTTGLGFLNKNIAEAISGNQQARQTFQDLGVSIQQTDGSVRPTIEVLQAIADRFATTENSAAKAALSMQAFGKGGREMIPLLNQGKDGLAAMGVEAEKLGGVLSEKNLKAAAEFNDQIDRMTTLLAALRNTVGVALIPTFNELLEQFLKLGKGGGFELFEGGMKRIQAGLIGLGTLLQETAAYFKAFYGAATGEGLKHVGEQLNAEIDAIEKTAKEKFFILRRGLPADFFAEPTQAQPKDQLKVTAPPDVEALNRELEAIRKAKDDAAKYDLETAKLAAEAGLIMQEDYLKQGLITEEQWLEVKKGARLHEHHATVQALREELDAEQEYWVARQKLGFKNQEAEELATTKHILALLAIKRKEHQEDLKQQNEGLKEFVADKALGRRRQVESGGRTVESTKSEYEIGEAQRAREIDETIMLAQAKIDAGEKEFASFEELAALRQDLLQANMAKELKLTVDQSQRILQLRRFGLGVEADEILETSERTEQERLAILTKYEAAMNQERRRQFGGFFEGYAEGLVKYVNDTQTMFGLAVDSARQTAQAMQQGFRTFFFDAMEGRIQSFKDVLMSTTNVAKQIVSQVASIMVTGSILRGIAGAGFAIPGFGGAGGPQTEASFAAAGGTLPGFQTGGAFVIPGTGGPDSRLVAFRGTPGEKVSIQTPDQQRGGNGGISVVVNNYTNGEATVQDGGRGPDGRQLISVTIRERMKAELRSGALDRDFAANYGVSRKGVAR